MLSILFLFCFFFWNSLVFSLSMSSKAFSSFFSKYSTELNASGTYGKCFDWEAKLARWSLWWQSKNSLHIRLLIISCKIRTSILFLQPIAPVLIQSKAFLRQFQSHNQVYVETPINFSILLSGHQYYILT